jgi:hypothetical protein
MSIISARRRTEVVGVLILGRIILAVLLPRLSLLRRKFYLPPYSLLFVCLDVC